jgi:lipoate---protein ligase
MRAAVRLPARFARWTTPSPFPHLSSQCRQSHNGPDRTWNLKELGRVSKEAGPFVFHLPSNDPYLNLSIEHFLFSKAHPDSHILLFYTNRPSVVIGRNQNPWLETDLKLILGGLQNDEAFWEANTSPRGRHSPALLVRHRTDITKVRPVDLVRRRSGGGTVFHDYGNLNYSVITPHTKSWSRSSHAEMVVQALRTLKTVTDRGLPIILPEVRVNERNDIVMQRPDETQWLKISGSAFKLTKDRALHHGTLLYSSASINRISDLLRSPGRGLITAHGVESVRSKVGNLSWTAAREKRHRTKNCITEAIATQFWHLYGGSQQGVAGVNEIILSSPVSLEELAEQNPIIAKGHQELASSAWTFEQTPKFDFDSGMLENHAIKFHAVKGVLKQLEVTSPVPGSGESPGGMVWRQHKRDFGGGAARAGTEDGEDNIKLHEVKNWRTLVAESLSRESSDSEAGGQDQKQQAMEMEANVPAALVERLEAIFPLYKPAKRPESRPFARCSSVGG